MYKSPTFPGETFSEDEMGESFVFAVTDRYFPECFDCMDETLFGIVLRGYSYSKISYSTSEPALNNDAKPWWKFW